MAEERTSPLPFVRGPDGRTATWNPALAWGRWVTLVVRTADGRYERRRAANAGRARVGPGEWIAAVEGEPLD